MSNLFAIIENQQKGHENEPRYTIGEQLKDIAAREPLAAELLEKDLAIPEMSLAAAEKKLQEYADKNHKSAKCYCITPTVAEKILREFYGIPDPGEAPAPAEKTNDDYIDLSSFL